MYKRQDQAIRDLVEKEIAAGLKSVTDGEFRRAYWHLDFFWGFGGIDHVQAAQGYQFHDETTKADSALVVGKITGANHPFVAVSYTHLDVYKRQPENIPSFRVRGLSQNCPSRALPLPSLRSRKRLSPQRSRL